MPVHQRGDTDMPNRNNGWQVGGQRFPLPGEDDEPEPEDTRPTIGGVGSDVKDPNVIDQAVTAGRQHLAKHTAQKLERSNVPAGHYPQPPPPLNFYEEKRKPLAERERVYYMRIGNRCKIGYTSDIWVRLNNINPEEFLAVERGGRTLERWRHEQFADLRTNGEWFRYEEPLVGHVAQLVPYSRTEVDQYVARRKKQQASPAPGRSKTPRLRK
jgi:hypothetical protein